MKENFVESLKIAPPGGVVIAHFAGYTISTWVSILTLVYILMLIFEKAYGWLRKARATNKPRLRRRKNERAG